MGQITTHILDTASGLPAAGVDLSLSVLKDNSWQVLASAVTNSDGRAPELCSEDNLPAGTYKMHFDTEAYFLAKQSPVFYPWVDIVFKLEAGGQHYHVPLLLSPFGYSTYRGS